MACWRLTKNFLKNLYTNWTEYYNARIDAVNEIYAYASKKVQAEAEDDLKNHRYESNSVQNWFNHKINELNTWFSDAVATLKNEDEEFELLYQKLVNDKYTEQDYGFEIIYDFKTFQKNRTRDYSLDNGHFKVSVKGQSHWYSYGENKKNFNLLLPKVEFESIKM